jgi:hypothetical protein
MDPTIERSPIFILEKNILASPTLLAPEREPDLKFATITSSKLITSTNPNSKST